MVLNLCIRPTANSFNGNPSDDYATVTKTKTRSLLKIATWNVRTLHQDGKLENVIDEMNRLQLEILGCSEIRWTHSGKITHNKVTFVYSGADKDHVRGVGIFLGPRVAASLLGYWPVSDRVIIAKIKAQPFNMNIIQVYAPTSSSSDDDLETFYADMDKAMNQCQSQEVNIVLGDMNAKVGKGRYHDIVGPWGLGTRNDRGDTLVQWCEQKDLFIANTWFCQHPRRLWTWRNPDDNTRNQIDYITVNKRFRNSVTKVKCFPGADCNSDHVLLVCWFRLKLKKLIQPIQRSKLDVKTLRTDDLIRIDFAAEVKSLTTKQMNLDLVEDYSDLQQALTTAAEKVVPRVSKQTTQEWMTPEILDLMEERRKCKKNNQQYKQLDRIIRNKCLEAKESFYSRQCKELERLERSNPQAMHDKVRKITGRQKRSQASHCIEDKNGAMIMEKDKI